MLGFAAQLTRWQMATKSASLSRFVLLTLKYEANEKSKDTPKENNVKQPALIGNSQQFYGQANEVHNWRKHHKNPDDAHEKQEHSSNNGNDTCTEKAFEEWPLIVRWCHLRLPLSKEINIVGV